MDEPSPHLTDMRHALTLATACAQAALGKCKADGRACGPACECTLFMLREIGRMTPRAGNMLRR